MLAFFLLGLFALPQVQNQVVDTVYGQVRGANAGDGNYSAFYGIRYGSVGNRFAAPSLPPVLTGIFDANQNILCAQPGPNNTLVGVEDCLTLNVFTSEPNANASQPVLVYIGGEEYANDNNLGSPRRLVQEGLVVVTLNYRLSVFGFLCLRTQTAPGNAGLKDIILGLRWVQENINSFGGNSSNVMLLGHGSGAAIVDLVTLSPLSENLVHKAMTLSGSALAPWAVAYEPVEYAAIFASRLGFEAQNITELGSIFANISANTLVSQINTDKFYNNTPLFAPCIEDPRILSANETVLTAAPITTLREGNYTHIPYIMGFVDLEGTIRAEEMYSNVWLEPMQSNFSQFIQVDLDFESTAVSTNVTQVIRQRYFGDRVIGVETAADYLEYHGDTMILVSLIRSARERAATSTADVRLFEFAFIGSNSSWPFTHIEMTGARHGSILNYLFEYELREIDSMVVDELMGRIASFAETGVPQHSPQSVIWNPIQDQIYPALYYAGGDGPVPDLTLFFTVQTRQNPYNDKISFWNDIYSSYYRTPVFVPSSASKLSVFLTVLVCTSKIVMLTLRLIGQLE